MAYKCFDLGDGKSRVCFNLSNDDAEPFLAFMGECRKAIAIADESMFELLSSSCRGIPEPGELLIPVDEDCNEVELVDLACSEIIDAVEWLKPRGYVDVVAGPNGAEGILVLRRPD